jgi:hypothetical protein
MSSCEGREFDRRCGGRECDRRPRTSVRSASSTAPSRAREGVARSTCHVA